MFFATEPTAVPGPDLADQPLPLLHFPVLWHLGTLNPADKASQWKFSQEGAGLSVSVHPLDWEAIARLGGQPAWALTRPGNRLLDYHALTIEQRDAISAWGVAQGYLRTGTFWRVSGVDLDTEQDVVFWSDDYDEALDWADEQAEAFDQPVTQPEPGIRWVATATFPDPTVREGDLDPHDLLTVCWLAASHPDVDGMWWQDEYRPAALCCPRGVLHPQHVSSWQAAPVDRRDLPYPSEG